MLVFSLGNLSAQDYIVLETTNGKTTKKGNLSLENREASAASTFKVVLAWAGIDAGVVDAASLKNVADKHVPGSPRKITLKQAMFYSSNDYFKELAAELPYGNLLKFAEASSLFTKPLDKSWLGPGLAGVEKGGTMKTTPVLNHAWMVKVASGTWIKRPEVQQELEKAMFWPSPQKDIQLFGKTGTIKGAVWFNGFGKTAQGTKVVTVFIPGMIEDRPRAIALFYEAFGLKWDEKLAKQLE
jgi:beta-lactamase class D